MARAFNQRSVYRASRIKDRNPACLAITLLSTFLEVYLFLNPIPWTHMLSPKKAGEKSRAADFRILPGSPSASAHDKRACNTLHCLPCAIRKYKQKKENEIAVPDSNDEGSSSRVLRFIPPGPPHQFVAKKLVLSILELVQAKSRGPRVSGHSVRRVGATDSFIYGSKLFTLE